MRSRGRVRLALWSCTAFLAGAAATAAQPDAAKELQKLLARAPSPGALALLASHLNDPAAAARVQAGIADHDPRTRETAARLVDLGALRDLLPDVQRALETETDALAAEEELRALLTLGGDALDETTVAAARRFSPALDASYALMLARARGPHAMPRYFDALRGWSLSDATVRRFFRYATRGQHDALMAAASLALSRHDAEAWQALLSVAGDFGVDVDPPVVLAALGSKEPNLRGETAWYAARHYHGNPPPNAAAILAALDDGERDAEPGGPEVHFGDQILRRVLGQKPVEDDAWIACLESSLTCHLDSDFEDSPLLEYLTDREREAILRRNRSNRPADLPTKKKEPKPAGWKPGTPLLQLVSDLPTGVARDVFALEGCQSTSFTRWLSLAAVDFRPDGVPRKLTIAAQPERPGCQRTSQALFLLTLAPAEMADAASESVSMIVLFDPDAYTCADRAALARVSPKAPTDPVKVRGAVVAPKLIKRVQPIYPPASRKAHEEGVSVYEAIISPEGCVVEPRLLRSSTPVLDAMGMEALTRWQYQPATLNGQPVRVYLTVTVTYRLN
ncbi:MAG TPA: TonB family protein [Thermoanaerobaculia bacterium]